MVRLKPVTGENLDEVLALKVHESQAGFVSTTAESLAQAYVYPETAFPFLTARPLSGGRKNVRSGIPRCFSPAAACCSPLHSPSGYGRIPGGR